jgi:uncharacterized protein (DUF305 family)
MMSKVHKAAAVMVATLVSVIFGCGSKVAPYDLRFMDTMTAQDKTEIAIAQLVETTAVHSELAALAKEVISAQTHDTAQFGEWRAKWYGKRPLAVDRQLAGSESTMTRINAEQAALLSGNDLDRYLIGGMLPYHRAAAAMARDAESRARHPELKAFAATVTDSYERQIEVMNRLAAEWEKIQ